ncbi:MAG: hypothetical protein JXA13_07860 [Anaerolineales bacterium]|nr:hypothetical protein [Anaerolineales bacterium]
MDKSSKRWWYLGGLIVLLLAAAAAVVVLKFNKPGEPDIPGQTATPGVVEDDGEKPMDEGEANLSIRLSEGSSTPQDSAPLPVAAGQTLSAEETTRLLARLPDLQVDPGDITDFNLPEDVLPPPRTGDTIQEIFPLPPEETPPEVVAGPLEVLRYSPEGEIPIAPFVNITFNQPMTTLATINDLAEQDVPVKVSPSLPGTWRWLGTKTLNFQYESDLVDRMPMATEYEVTIPAGTTSVTGGVLDEEIRFKFSTPPATMLRYYPRDYEPQPLEPLFFIEFDQRIEPEVVLKTIQVAAEGTPVSVKPATPEDIEGDEAVNRLVENAAAGRWMVFKVLEPLPKDSSIQVEIGPGTPSAEGPLLTTEAQTYSFQTYAPLDIIRHGCSWYDDVCRPLAPFYVEFNNPIDLEVFDESMLDVTPEIPGMVVNVFGDTINIQGATEGQTTYRIQISRQLQDSFGQKLGSDKFLSIKVGPAEPYLAGPDDIFVTLDPAAARPVLSLYSMNYNRLDVQVYRVAPSDWDAFKNYLRQYQQTDLLPQPPGRLVRDETIRLDGNTDKLTEVGIDLSKDMDGEYGHFIVIARPPKGLFQQERYWEHVMIWVQVTQIGLDAFLDHSEMVVWATDLKNGAPLEEITVKSNTDKTLAATSAAGLARFDIPAGDTTYITAQRGQDIAMLPASMSYWDENGWSSRHVSDDLRWYVVDDRAMYRPGEEVHIKGWLRRIGGLQDGDVGLVGNRLAGTGYQVFDPQGNNLTAGSLEVNALGGFDFSFTIPENANLGYATIQFDASVSGIGNTVYSHSFQIQEFRRPEFEVTARNETTGPYFVGDSATVAVEASYYAGGPLPNAEVAWNISFSPTNYTPPNWPDFTFGVWQPWWQNYSEAGPGDGQPQYLSFNGTTDATGSHYLKMDFEKAEGLRPFSVLAEAAVMDVNRQAWAGTTSLLVHPAELYVGMRSERYFVERGDPLVIEAIITDLDGKPIPDRPFTITASRLVWKYKGGEWKQTEVDAQECERTSGLEPISCSFETPVGGIYQIKAILSDDSGRQNKTMFNRWVSGAERPPSREVEKEEAALIPDKETYQPGDVAEILVQSPFTPAEGLLTVSRSGFLYTERFLVEDGSFTLKVPIEDAHIPNLNIQVDLVGAAPRTDDLGKPVKGIPDRPAYASGNLSLSVPPLQRTLEMTVTPAASNLEPGGETLLEIRLRDAAGQPVPDAELAVLVVDEAILALSNYQLADPIPVFYANRPSGVGSRYSRDTIILADPMAFAQSGDASQMKLYPTATVARDSMMLSGAAAPEPAMEEMDMAASSEKGSINTSITVRSDFNPLATFAPDVRTDRDGNASVSIKLPDNLTRYRIMVVAVDSRGSRFGAAEANLVARLPLMVRPSAPRFLNFGDVFELPVVLQNQTDEEMIVDVAAEGTNVLFTGGAGQRVTVPANDRIEVRFPVATDRAGTARFQVAAVSNTYADAATIELPIYTPATTEAFAAYGVVDQGAVFQPVSAPEDVFRQYGGLEIQTSSTALQTLTDAVLYLYGYPFECSEQRSARILGIAALRDVLTAFEAEGLPSPEDMETAVDRDIEQLQVLQNYDGGFPYWRRGQESIPFNTIHTAHALQRAEQKGFTVPAVMQENALYYLRDIESHYPYWYSLRTRWTLSAYALYVRDLMGDSDPAKARQLLDEAGLENLPLDAVGWIWQALVDDPNSGPELESIRQLVSNRVVETAGAANFTIEYDDQTYLLLSSNRRTDAILLDALMADDPDSDLIPKVVNGLLAHRTRGRWGNTQENVFVLVALDRYFNTYEAQTPDFVARIWLGETYAGEHTYEGYTTERHNTSIPMSFLVDPQLGGGQEQDLVISKEGAGRLYYRLGLRYAPTDLWLDPLDMGFVVQREYEAVDNPEDVYRDKDGVWHVKAGARVRIRLTMAADNRRYHVALVDPLPAGLEIINPALAVSGSVPQDPESPEARYGWWWWGTWYEHQNMRDERAEAFASLLWDGVYEYTYVARATTPGTFVAPPAKAEEMYSPEVFGRSGSDWLIVE